MGVNLSIKDVPDALAQRLRERAQRNHRSLQRELMFIVEKAAAEDAISSATTPAAAAHGARAAAAPRDDLPPAWTQGWKSIEQLVAERKAAGWRPDPSLARAPLGVDIARADRDAR